MLESGPYLGPEIGQCIFFFSVYICRLDMYISTYEKEEKNPKSLSV
jgi:hypothetical protein